MRGRHGVLFILFTTGLGCAPGTYRCNGRKCLLPNPTRPLGGVWAMPEKCGNTTEKTNNAKRDRVPFFAKATTSSIDFTGQR